MAIYKLKQIAPFFDLETKEFKKILEEIHLIYPFQTTLLGTFRLKTEDIAIIEFYLNLKKLFPDKKECLEQLQINLNAKGISTESEWIKELKKKNGLS